MNQGQELRPDSHQDQSKEEELNIAAAETVSVLNNAPSSKGIRISSRFEPIVWNDLITLCAAFGESSYQPLARRQDAADRTCSVLARTINPTPILR